MGYATTTDLITRYGLRPMSGAADATWAALRATFGDRLATTPEPDDSLAIDHAGRRLYLLVLPLGEDIAAVQVLAPLLSGVVPDERLYEVLATAELLFGRFLVLPGDGDTAVVVLVHRIVAGPLDPAELAVVMDEVAAAADRWDPELEAAFGATWTLEPPEGGS